MAYKILEQDGFIEVQISGETSEWELLRVVQELRERDPRKEVSDLWVISEESTIPLSAFPTLVERIQMLCSEGMAANKTALVASSEFQKAVLKLYQSAAMALPFTVGVFASREAAVQWLKA